MLKTAIIGAGGISHAHVEAIGQMENITVAGVIDVNRSKAETLAAMVGVEVYDRFEDLLPRIDAIHILTPPSTHREYAVKALATGKAVFCEKPMTVTIEDATAIVEAVEKYDGIFMVALTCDFALLSCGLKKSSSEGIWARSSTSSVTGSEPGQDWAVRNFGRVGAPTHGSPAE